MKVIQFLRALVRPYLELLLGSTLVGLAIWLSIKFADAELARTIVTVVVTAGVSLFGFYFGERSSKKAEEK